MIGPDSYRTVLSGWIARRGTERLRALGYGACLLAMLLGGPGMAATSEPDRSRAAALLEQAQQTADPGQRIRLLETSLAHAPSFNAWYFIGRAHQELGANDQARDAFLNAYRIAPDAKTTALAMARGGEAAIAEGELADGLTMARSALERYPDAPPSWMEALVLQGDLERSGRIESSRAIVQALQGEGNSRAFGVVRRHIDLHIHFAYDRDDVDSTPEGARQVDELVKAVREIGPIDQHYQLIGHTDLRGTEDYNRALSQRRAVSVKDYVAIRAPEVADRLCALGKGKSSPLHPGDSEEVHRVNRRVEVRIVDGCE
ncbi:MAG: hypothetical protein EOM22_00360 [Gammaproteobacteria bacterium]|nr:hypothetical protein [Gammaproteobacteria bacterium]